MEPVGEFVGVEVADGFGRLAGCAWLGVVGAEAGEGVGGDGRGPGHAGLHFGGVLFSVQGAGWSGDALV